VIEYGDYQCPYCARAHEALTQLRTKMGDKMRLVYRHYPRPAPHPHAELAAEAAEAAGAQGKFWEMHDKLYENQARLSPGVIPELVGELGLDAARFNDESGARRYRARVDRDAQQAILMGANATPIAFAEVYLALQNKTVDGQENPLTTIEAKKFYEVQSHINLTGHITEMLLTIVSGQTWNKMSDADKKVFETVLKQAGAKATDEIAASEAKLVDDFTTKYKKTVVKSDRAAFAKVFQKEHLGASATWDKSVYDQVQALK
jgi:hypothetical protein